MAARESALGSKELLGGRGQSLGAGGQGLGQRAARLGGREGTGCGFPLVKMRRSCDCLKRPHALVDKISTPGLGVLRRHNCTCQAEGSPDHGADWEVPGGLETGERGALTRM